jgi:hypothetical protein
VNMNSVEIHGSSLRLLRSAKSQFLLNEAVSRKWTVPKRFNALKVEKGVPCKKAPAGKGL